MSNFKQTFQHHIAIPKEKYSVNVLEHLKEKYRRKILVLQENIDNINRILECREYESNIKKRVETWKVETLQEGGK